MGIQTLWSYNRSYSFLFPRDQGLRKVLKWTFLMFSRDFCLQVNLTRSFLLLVWVQLEFRCMMGLLEPWRYGIQLVDKIG